MSNEAERLARAWLEAWEKLDPESLPLAEDFTHSSPLMGVQKGRDNYIAKTKPLAEKNVSKIRILRIVSEGNWAVIWYETDGPNGVLPACDWIRVEEGEIKEVYGFYDTAGLHTN